jgi:hypothetical protein
MLSKEQIINLRPLKRAPETIISETKIKSKTLHLLSDNNKFLVVYESAIFDFLVWESEELEIIGTFPTMEEAEVFRILKEDR